MNRTLQPICTLQQLLGNSLQPAVKMCCRPRFKLSPAFFRLRFQLLPGLCLGIGHYFGCHIDNLIFFAMIACAAIARVFVPVINVVVVVCVVGCNGHTGVAFVALVVPQHHREGWPPQSLLTTASSLNCRLRHRGVGTLNDE